MSAFKELFPEQGPHFAFADLIPQAQLVQKRIVRFERADLFRPPTYASIHMQIIV